MVKKSMEHWESGPAHQQPPAQRIAGRPQERTTGPPEYISPPAFLSALSHVFFSFPPPGSLPFSVPSLSGFLPLFPELEPHFGLRNVDASSTSWLVSVLVQGQRRKEGREASWWSGPQGAASLFFFLNETECTFD